VVFNLVSTSPEQTEALVGAVADRRPLTKAAAVHDAADAGRLPGKTVLFPTDQ
jgi:hypothetical protein